jgi:hypothetical protein
MATALPLATGANPGMEQYVARAQALTPELQMTPELQAMMQQNMQQRSVNLPLAMGAMLSGDKGMQGLGGTLFKDAMDARNPQALGDEGFFDPQSGKFVANPIGKMKRDQRVTELGMKLSEQDSIAKDRAAAALASRESSENFKALTLSIQQQQLDLAKREAGRKDIDLDERVRKAESDRQQGEAIDAQIELAKADGFMPLGVNRAEYLKLAAAERARIDKTSGAIDDAIAKAQARQLKLDEFITLNSKTSTGGLYDRTLPDSKIAHGSDKNQMIALSQDIQALAPPVGQGSVSNYERQIFAGGSVGLANDFEGNKKIAQRNQAAIEVMKERRALMTEFTTKYGFYGAQGEKWVSDQIDKNHGVTPITSTGGQLQNNYTETRDIGGKKYGKKTDGSWHVME